MFNGREPDERRTDFDFGALDSVSGRLWFLPTANLAFQVSAGRLTEAEAEPKMEARASTLRERRRPAPITCVFVTTASGRRRSRGEEMRSQAGQRMRCLLETNLTFDDRNTWFGRFEVAGKTAHDLDVAAVSDAFTVAKLQGGYTRYLDAWGAFMPGLGATLSAGLVPKELEAVYGSRANIGFGVFATLRPVATPAAATLAAPGGRTMVMTATDPGRR